MTATSANPEFATTAPMTGLMPDVERELRYARAIEAIVPPHANRHRRWNSTPTPGKRLAAALTASIATVDACLAEKPDGYALSDRWSGYLHMASYLHAAKAIAQFSAGDGAGALVSLKQARQLVDWKNATYAGLGVYQKTHYYLWLLCRIADLGETAGEWATVTEVLEHVLEVASSKWWRVVDALAGQIGRIREEDMGGLADMTSPCIPASEPGSPLPELWARLANAYANVPGNYAQVIKLYRSLQEAGCKLNGDQNKQLQHALMIAGEVVAAGTLTEERM